MTQPLRECLSDWAVAEGLDPEGVMATLTHHITGERNRLQALECGELTRAEIEPWIADLFALHGPRPEPSGIFDRMFAPMRTLPEMLDLLRMSRARGLRTGLLSNSWGDSYDRRGWETAFDAVVISGEVGMRKPDPAIFEHVLGLLDLPAGDVVYVDDEPPNVMAARDFGLRAVHCDPADPHRIERIVEALGWDHGARPLSEWAE